MRLGYQELAERTGMDVTQVRELAGGREAAEWFEKRTEPRAERPRGLIGAGRVQVRERKA